MISLLFALLANASADTNCPKLEQIRLAMNVSASNIANAETTRTPEGGPYRPKRIHCHAQGCQVIASRKITVSFEPEHPDADENGFVAYPYIDLDKENLEMDRLVQAYENELKSCHSKF